MASHFTTLDIQRAQDMVSYDKKYPKEHVERMVISLERIALDHEIPWTYPNETLFAYDIIITELFRKFGVEYHFDDMNAIVEKLHERYEVFMKLLNTNGLQFDVVKNKFLQTEDKVWDKLISDQRCLWYFHLGDPMLSDLRVIFEGPSLGVSSDSNFSMCSNPNEIASVNEDEEIDAYMRCFEIDQAENHKSLKSLNFGFTVFSIHEETKPGSHLMILSNWEFENPFSEEGKL